MTYCYVTVKLENEVLVYGCNINLLAEHKCQKEKHTHSNK